MVQKVEGIKSQLEIRKWNVFHDSSLFGSTMQIKFSETKQALYLSLQIMES